MSAADCKVNGRTTGDLRSAVEDLARALTVEWKTEARTRRLLDHPPPRSLQWRNSAPTTSSQGILPIESVGSQLSPRTRVRGDATDIADLFHGLQDRQLVILGAPGAGKTVTAILLMLRLLDDRTPDAPVPVLMNLSSWDPLREPLDVWLGRRIGEEYTFLRNTSRYGRSAHARLVEERKVLPILDGLDEIHPYLRTDAIDGIERGLGHHWPAIITSRNAEYESAITHGTFLRRAAVVEILEQRQHVLLLDDDGAVVYLSTMAGPTGLLEANIDEIRALYMGSAMPSARRESDHLADAFEKLLNTRRCREQDIQEFLAAHPEFLLGDEYDAAISQLVLPIGNGESFRPDFILRPLAGVTWDARVVELKLPSQRVLRPRPIHREGLYAAVYDGVRQLRTYQRYFEQDVNRTNFAQVNGFTVHRPRLALIVGRTRDFPPEGTFADLVDDVTPVDILSYDDLILRYRRLIEGRRTN